MIMTYAANSREIEKQLHSLITIVQEESAYSAETASITGDEEITICSEWLPQSPLVIRPDLVSRSPRSNTPTYMTSIYTLLPHTPLLARCHPRCIRTYCFYTSYPITKPCTVDFPRLVRAMTSLHTCSPIYCVHRLVSGWGRGTGVPRNPLGCLRFR
jgi:hypothetical protein